MSPTWMNALLERTAGVIGPGNLTQRVNGLAARWAAIRNRTDNCPHPWMLQIEVTNRCNLNCAICSRSVAEMKLGDLDPALYPAVADISGNAQEVALFGYGEPLMSKAFYDLLPLLRSASIGFFTNGLLLDSQRMHQILNLTQRPLKYIVFSIDGATQDTYGAIRSGAPLHRVWSNLENTIKIRDQERLEDLALKIEFVAMASNVSQLPEMVRKADEAGVDILKVSHLVVWNESMRSESLLYHPSEARQYFQEAQQEAQSRRLTLNLPREIYPDGGATPDKFPQCRYPWYYAMITHEGHIRACCFAQDFDFGDLNRSSFETIWDGESYRQLRRTVNTMDCPKVCRFCEERFRTSASPDDERTYIKLSPRAK